MITMMINNSLHASMSIVDRHSVNHDRLYGGGVKVDKYFDVFEIYICDSTYERIMTIKLYEKCPVIFDQN